MMARLDGVLAESERGGFDAHLAGCADCRRAYHELTSAHQALDNLGRALHAPEVDLTARILDRVQDIKAGHRTIPEAELPEHPQVLPYLDGELDDLAAARFQRLLEANAALAEEVSALRKVDKALRTTADAVRPKAPSIAMVPVVRDAIAARHAAEDDPGVHGLEDALWRMGDDLRMASPEVDLAQEVSATAERRGIAGMEQDLAAIGHAIHAATPRVELSTSIAQAVKREQWREAKEARGHASRRAARSAVPWGKLAVLAVAACLVLITALVTSGAGERSGTLLRRAYQVATGQGAEDPDRVRIPAPKEELPRVAPPDLSAPTVAVLEENEDANTPEQEGTPRPGSLEEAIEAHRQAMQKDGNGDALRQLAAWGDFTPEEARALIESGKLSLDETVAASRFLPAEEATALLENMVSDNPDDPYLRLALARSLSESGASMEAQLAQIQAWGALDTENGLPSYFEAALHFENGDYAAGLEALAQGSAYDESRPYSLASTNANAALLEAAGVEPSTARYLAALLGGNDEYADLIALRDDLLDVAEEYEEAGDYDSATQIYESLVDLGSQMSEGAEVPSDTQAALQTIDAATRALEQLYAIVGNPEALEVLGRAMSNLVNMLGDFAALYEQFNVLMGGSPDIVSTMLEDYLRGLFWDLSNP